MSKQNKLSAKYQVWIDARERFHLSHAHVQMARELGMNPKKFGKLANHNQEPWKATLPIFIQRLYLRHFGKERPDNVRSIEQLVSDRKQKKAERKQRVSSPAAELGADPSHAEAADVEQRANVQRANVPVTLRMCKRSGSNQL